MDDLILFSNADSASVHILKGAMDIFAELSSLSLTHHKSAVFLAGIDEQDQNALVNLLGIQKSRYPPTYLGVSLITTKLRSIDYLPLVERIKGRVKQWTSATLSYAGRLQLINSVIFAIQVYWYTKFILPAYTIVQIERILSNFLWKGASLSLGGAKVVWKEVCISKNKGGLGIKSLGMWGSHAQAYMEHPYG